MSTDQTRDWRFVRNGHCRDGARIENEEDDGYGVSMPKLQVDEDWKSDFVY